MLMWTLVALNSFPKQHQDEKPNLGNMAFSTFYDINVFSFENVNTYILFNWHDLIKIVH